MRGLLLGTVLSASFCLGAMPLSDGVKVFEDSPRYDLRPGLKIACRVRVDEIRSRGYTTLLGKGLITEPGSFTLRVDQPQEGGRFSFFINLGDGPGPRATFADPVKPGVTYDLVAGWDGREIYLTVNGSTHRTPRAGRPQGNFAPLAVGPLTGEITDWSVTGPETPPNADATIADRLRMAFDVTFDEKPSESRILVYKRDEYLLRYDVEKSGKRGFRLFLNLNGNLEPRLELPLDAEAGRRYRVAASWNGEKAVLQADDRRVEMKRFGRWTATVNRLVTGSAPGKVRVENLALSSEKRPKPTLGDFHSQEPMPTFGKPFTLVGEVGNLGGAPLGGAEVELTAEGDARVSSTKASVGEVGTFERRRLAWRIDPGTNKAVVVHARMTMSDENPIEVTKKVVLMPERMPDKSAKAWNPPVKATRTFYVDAVGGDDAADGLSERTAWKSFRNVNGRTLGPGERLLLRRDSLFREELVVTAKGSRDNWAEIGAYGKGGRPCIARTRHIDDRCAYVLDPSFLVVRDLVVCNAGQGLEIDCDAPGTGDVLVERCLGHHVEGSYAFNSHGIPEWFDHIGAPRKGHPATYRSFGLSLVGRNARNTVMRDCEVYQCSCGFALAGENVYGGRLFCHDEYAHNTSPHPSVYPTERAWLVDSVFDAAGWHASAGTMGLFLAFNDGMVVRNCHFLNQPDSGSPDEGGIDFEAGGDNYLVEGCTFRNNAGAAIEVLGFMGTQAHNIHIRNSRFDRDNVKRKLGPSEIFVGGGDGNHRVWCSTGSVIGNGYSLLDGVQFYTNREATTWADWDVRDNRGFASSEALAKAFPFNEPPRIEPGEEIWTDRAEVSLRGKVTDDGRPKGAALSVGWERLEGPAGVRFAAEAAETAAAFPGVGDYRLLLRADDGELWRSERTEVHVLPKGVRMVRAWTFSKNLDKEGWRAKGLGTKKEVYPAGKGWRTTPTPSEPVDLVCGDYWVMAVKNATKANLLSPDGLDLALKPGMSLRVKMQNHTNAKRMRLCWMTEESPKWNRSNSVVFDVKPGDKDDSVCVVPLPADGTLRRLGLALSPDGESVTGTLRIDYAAVVERDGE